jgi:hypothetical protein
MMRVEGCALCGNWICDGELLVIDRSVLPPSTRKVDASQFRPPGGLMEQSNAAIQRGRLAAGFCVAVG